MTEERKEELKIKAYAMSGKELDYINKFREEHKDIFNSWLNVYKKYTERVFWHVMDFHGWMLAFTGGKFTYTIELKPEECLNNEYDEFILNSLTYLLNVEAQRKYGIGKYKSRLKDIRGRKVFTYLLASNETEDEVLEDKLDRDELLADKHYELLDSGVTVEERAANMKAYVKELHDKSKKEEVEDEDK